MDTLIKKINNIDIIVTIDGMGDSTNDISFTYIDSTISYIKVFGEGDIVHIELDSFDTKRGVREELSLFFKQEIVEYILNCMFQEINNKLEWNTLPSDSVFLEIDLSGFTDRM